MKSIFLVLMLAVMFAGEVFAQSPVSNMRVQRVDTVIVVFYDLAATTNVEAFASFDNGANFIGPLKHVTGAVGNNVSSGKDKILMWDVVSEVGVTESSNVMFRLVTGTEQTSSILAEGNLIARKGKVFLYDLQMLNDRLLLGDKVFKTREPLKTDEVRQIMANSNALWGYNKGIKQNRNGNILMIAGGGLAAVGGVMMLTKPFERRYNLTVYGEHGSAFVLIGSAFWYKEFVNIPGYGNNNSYDFYVYDDGHVCVEVGFVAALAGVVVIGTGAILKVFSNRLIHQSVDAYNNSGRPLSRLEYDFNFTGKGVNLAIRF